jgi:hypothetical protein
LRELPNFQVQLSSIQFNGAPPRSFDCVDHRKTHDRDHCKTDKQLDGWFWNLSENIIHEHQRVGAKYVPRAALCLRFWPVFAAANNTVRGTKLSLRLRQ